MGPVPVTASSRRRLEPMEASDTTLMGPMSPVRRTWVPPHSSVEWRPGLEHAHDVAVLLAEEGDGAELGRLGLGGLEVADGLVGEDVVVDQVLDGLRSGRA